ncbi:MAG: nuclear transport factor 2 family protein [Actinomycetes bacterium]
MTTHPASDQTLVEQVRRALAAGDLTTLRQLVHPYVRWIDETQGRVIVGRRNVISLVRQVPPPRGVELRDGQVYRWYV